jgi:hypothetical protein
MTHHLPRIDLLLASAAVMPERASEQQRAIGEALRPRDLRRGR